MYPPDDANPEPDGPAHGHSNDEHAEHLLDLMLGAGVVGACAGGLVTLLTLVPVRTLVTCAPAALPLAHVLLTACTCAVAMTGLAYLGRRAASGSLDRRVGRVLPLAFLLLVPMIAPWTRLVVAFPRFVEAGFAVSYATGLIALVSLLGTASTTNRVSAIFAGINACEYGMLSAGLALAGGPVALAGLAAAAATAGLLLAVQRRGLVDPTLLGGDARALPGVAVGLMLVLALGLSFAGLGAALAPEPQDLHLSHGPHRGAPVLLRGAVVTIPDDQLGCRQVDDES